MKRNSFYNIGRTRPWQRISNYLLTAVMITSTVLFMACGQQEEDMGELVISLTDAPGDFQAYNVDVVSLTLQKANGAEVDTLPLTTSVDFSQYTDMTEFLTAATVPNGIYTKAKMVLDYSQSTIIVEDENGESVKVNASNIMDEEGNSIDQLEVSVRLENRNALKIVPGVPMHLSLDFDLNASNSVSFEAGIPTVTVEPFLLAEVNKEGSKIHRVRGGLKSVNLEDNSFQVIIRPFVHRLQDEGQQFGTLNVSTGTDTNYEIDGTMVIGLDGLSVLNAKPPLTAVVVLGDLKFNPRRFEAREVRAGSSVPGGDSDVIAGNIVSRMVDATDNTTVLLGVKGATLIRSDSSVVFHDTAVIKVGADTVVRQQLSSSDHTVDDLSIGQRVSIFGDLTNSNVGELEMDATSGYANMKLTKLIGHAVDSSTVTYPSSNLVMDLQSIDHRRIGQFDFSGTGSNAEFDADPFEYEIDAGALDVSNVTANTPLKVLGHVKPWAKDFSFDFTAQSVIDVTQVKAAMAISWRPATDTPFISTSPSAIVFNLDGAGKFHHVSRAGVVIDLTQSSANPTLNAPQSGEGTFYILQGAVVKLHTNFASFVSELESLLADGVRVKGVKISGQYNNSSASISAMRVKIVMARLSINR